MPESHFEPGQSFPVQFAWRLPDDGMIYAVFRADVLDLVPGADKYIVLLGELLAGRESNGDGQSLPVEATSREYWALVGGLVGKKITVAYEADDGRALHMRLQTLTGEHNYFRRYDTAVATARRILGEDPTP